MNDGLFIESLVLVYNQTVFLRFDVYLLIGRLSSHHKTLS